MRNIVVVTVTYKSLGTLLGLPEGHVVTAVIPPTEHGLVNELLSVIVSGPQLPPHHEGSFPPHVSVDAGEMEGILR